jgi:hypothetical protein
LAGALFLFGRTGRQVWIGAYNSQSMVSRAWPREEGRQLASFGKGYDISIWLKYDITIWA